MQNGIGLLPGLAHGAAQPTRGCVSSLCRQEVLHAAALALLHEALVERPLLPQPQMLRQHLDQPQWHASHREGPAPFLGAQLLSLAPQTLHGRGGQRQ